MTRTITAATLGAALAYLALRFVIWPRWGLAGSDACMALGFAGLMLGCGVCVVATGRR